MTLDAIEIRGGSNLTEFIRLPWMIYRDYPNWVPPLLKDVRRQLDPHRNPFFEYGQVKLLAVANSAGKLLGRVASILNPEHGRLHQESAGFFGLFECIDSLEVAQTLFRAAGQHLRLHHCTHMIGPVNFTTNSETGILVEGFDRSPMVMCSYSPPYYAGLLEGCGFEKSMDLFSYEGSWDRCLPPKIQPGRQQNLLQSGHLPETLQPASCLARYCGHTRHLQPQLQSGVGVCPHVGCGSRDSREEISSPLRTNS